MVVDPQQGAPAAPTGDSENTAAQGNPEPSPAAVAPVAPAAAPADDAVLKAERDRRAREGRDRAAQDRRLSQIEQTVNATAQQFQTFLAQQAASEQQRIQARLDAIEDPGERALAELRLMRQQTAGVRPQPVQPARPVAPAVPPVDTTEETRDRAQLILDQINDELGTQVTLDTQGLDWREEAPFRASAYRLAAQQVRAQGAVRPTAATAATTGESNVPKKTEQDAGSVDVAEITRQVTEQVRRDLGVSSPASPQAASAQRSRAGVPTIEDLHKTVTAYDSKRGPKDRIRKLREQREALVQALPQQ